MYIDIVHRCRNELFINEHLKMVPFRAWVLNNNNVHVQLDKNYWFRGNNLILIVLTKEEKNC